MERREPRDRVPRRAWLPLGAAVVAVALILGAGGLWALGRGRPSGAPLADRAAPAPAGASRAGVVPWRPLPATNPTLPVVTIPARPSEAGAADLPRCTTAQVGVGRDQLDGAMGTTYRIVRLHLVGTTPCRLQGRPRIQLLADGHPVEVPVRDAPSVTGFAGGPVALTRHGPAVISLGWAAGHYCGPVKHVDRIRVDLRGPSAPFEIGGFGRTYCAPGEGIAPVFVQPVAPENYRPARRRSAYADVGATGDLDVTAAPHARVRFTVTLTSKRDLPLTPCPDYVILVASRIAASEHHFALNCAAVPHRDARGRPYLPAGVPVTFAMRTHAGSVTAHKFIWHLDTRYEQPAVDGTLTVRHTDGRGS